MTNDFIADVLAGRILLPVIPRVAQRLIHALRDPQAALAPISADLQQDPVLSAEVLRQANTACYGGRRAVASIDDAVRIIGTDALRHAVITCGIRAAFVTVPGVELARFWRHAMFTAAAAHGLGRLVGLDGGTAHAAGLLHRCGHLILCQAFPTAAQQQFRCRPLLDGAALAAREQQVFGIAHPTVGALWADQLAFPADTSAAMLDYAAPPDGVTPGCRLAGVVGLASTIATAAVAGDCAVAAAERIDPHRVDALPLAAGWLDDAFPRFYEALIRRT
jgi:HD-like signal output (HDOD) protein